MLRSIESILGSHVQAVDGRIGTAIDFYFDDHAWTVRYAVVDTGHWLPGKHVLISPGKLGEPDWEEQVLPVMLTTDEVKSSPGVEEDLPVSLRERIDMNRYFVWAPSWKVIGNPVTADSLGPVRPSGRAVGETMPQGDPRLRSVVEVRDYRINARAGEHAGRVEDFITETTTWMLRYLVLDLREWLPGKRVLVAPEWVQQVDWLDAQVHVDLTREEMEEAPEFDPEAPVNREVEERLYDYHGRPRYWEQ